MLIDKTDGSVVLPIGLSVSASLTQNEFCASPLGKHARRDERGTPHWIHYHFSGGHHSAGQINDKNLLVTLIFYDQLLVDVELTVDMYPPGPKVWSTYSLDVESATKEFHERLLEQLLGPAPVHHGSPRTFPPHQAALGIAREWTFAWGRVGSFHDDRGGRTFIRVRYGNRHEEASRAYREQMRSFDR